MISFLAVVRLLYSSASQRGRGAVIGWQVSAHDSVLIRPTKMSWCLTGWFHTPSIPRTMLPNYAIHKPCTTVTIHGLGVWHLFLLVPGCLFAWEHRLQHTLGEAYDSTSTGLLTSPLIRQAVFHTICPQWPCGRGKAGKDSLERSLKITPMWQAGFRILVKEPIWTHHGKKEGGNIPLFSQQPATFRYEQHLQSILDHLFTPCLSHLRTS